MASRPAGEDDRGETTEADIMIMGILYPEDLPWVIEEGIEFFVYDYPRLERSAEVAGMTGRKARIHLELETGGHRTGLEPDELNRTIDFLAEHRDRVNLGAPHPLSGIDPLPPVPHQHARRRLENLSERILEAGLKPRYFHTACSAAALAFPHTVRDLVPSVRPVRGALAGRSVPTRRWRRSCLKKATPKRSPLPSSRTHPNAPAESRKRRSNATFSPATNSPAL
ncbi:MAG: alanine racemase [Balneolaceae bacterium]|nr:alanine racemase [Balneolaceae bacterium]